MRLNVTIDGRPTGTISRVEDGSDRDNGFFRVSILEPDPPLAALLAERESGGTMELLIHLDDGRRMRVGGAWVHEIISDNGPLRCFLEADSVAYEPPSG
jgi:hypothetical protein